MYAWVHAPKSEQYHGALAVLLSVCSELQILVTQEKTEGPSTTLAVFGIDNSNANKAASR